MILQFEMVLHPFLSIHCIYLHQFLFLQGYSWDCNVRLIQYTLIPWISLYLSPQSYKKVCVLPLFLSTLSLPFFLSPGLYPNLYFNYFLTTQPCQFEMSTYKQKYLNQEFNLHHFVKKVKFF